MWELISAMSKTFEDDEKFVLSSIWHLRPFNGRGLLYKFTHDDSLLIKLPAFETVAMTLFDGHNQVGEVRRLLSEILAIDEQDADKVVQDLIKRNEENGMFLLPLSDANGEFTRINASRIFRELAAYTPPVSAEAVRLDSPLSLVLLPTYQCHTNCIYCYAQKPKLSSDAYMSPERWVEILIEAGELGIDLITFSGGDPLAYEDIDMLLAVASAYKMNFILPTKTLVTESRAKELAILLKNGGQIQISVDSLDPHISELMTGTKNYAEQARRSIINLRSAGLKVRTNTVVTPLNLSEIEALIRELRQLGVSICHITNYYRSHYHHSDDLFLNKEQIDNLNMLVRQLKKELAWKELSCNAGIRDFSISGNSKVEAWKERASCSGGYSSCVILPNGDVVLCEQVPHDHRFVVGNVAERSLMDVWNSKDLMDFIVPNKDLFNGTPCANCDEFDCCHRLYGRCFRDAYFNYGRIHSPSPNCPRAPLGIRMG
jgi:radical SAM protein with 4Fe4S-binding SPASM domain